MTVKDVMVLLDQVLPRDLVEEGDNCGLLIGCLEREVNHVRTALEASNEVIEQAIEDHVDMLIVHHPMIYTALKMINTESLRASKAMKLIEAGISLYVAHSNLDRAPGGLNRSFGTLIGAEDSRAFDDEGYILIGDLKGPIMLKEYVQQLSNRLQQGPLRYVGDDEHKVKRVAYCTGSGMGLIEDGLFDVADVYLTGDLKYHDAMDSHEKGQAIIDVTHFGSEVMAANVLYNLLQPLLSTIKVTEDTSIINPIKQ